MLDRIDKFAKFRFRDIPAWVVWIELFLAIGWARAAAEKLLDAGWWNGQTINEFVAEHDGSEIFWFAPVVDYVVTQNVGVVAIVFFVLQVWVTIGFALGVQRKRTLTLAIFMNACFLLAGAIDPSVFYLLAQGALALWVLESVDREEVSIRALRIGSLVATVLAVSSLPFIQSVQPAQMKEDTAAVVAMLAGLALVSALSIAPLTAKSTEVAPRNDSASRWLARWEEPATVPGND